MSKEEILTAEKVDKNELSQSEELSDKQLEKVTGGEISIDQPNLRPGAINVLDNSII